MNELKTTPVQSVFYLKLLTSCAVIVCSSFIATGSASIQTLEVDDSNIATLPAIAGSGTLIKTGTGTLTLTDTTTGTSTNTNANLTITAGTVSVTADTNIPGGTLTLNGGKLLASTGYVTSKAITMADNSSIGASSGTLTYSGIITDADTAKTLHISDGTVVLTLDNSSNTNTNLQVDTAATLSIGAANKLTGGTLTLNGGTLTASATIAALGKAIALTADSILDTGSHTVTADQAISGSHTLTMQSAGTLVLSGTNNTGGTALKITAGTVSVSAAANMPNGVLTLGGGTFVSTAGSAITIAPASVTLVDSVNTTINVGSNDLEIDAIITSNATSSSAGTFNKIGTGKLILGGTNTFTGITSVSAGPLQLKSNTGAGTGLISLAGTLEGNVLDGSFANAIDINVDAIFLATQSFTASGVISGAGGEPLTIDGAGGGTGKGNVTFSNANNSYVGTTTLTNGATLSVSALGQLSAAALIMSAGTTLNVTTGFTLAGGILLN